MNTTEFLMISAAIVPDRLAMIFEDTRLTYGDLQERVNRLSNWMASMGVSSGDRVAMLEVNCNQHIEAYFATAKLDAVYVPLNFRARSDELIYMVNDAEPKLMFVGERYVDMVKTSENKLTSVDTYVVIGDSENTWISYETAIQQGENEEAFPIGDDEDLTMLMFTAGTTGFPKGVMVTHDSFASYILSNVSPVELDEEDRNILTVPLYHIAGVQAVMAAVYGGRTLVIQRQFEASAWMELVAREKVTRAMMVPTMLKMLMDSPDFHHHDLTSLKVITYGAAPMPLEVIKRAITEFPDTHFINAFGQTETAATITMLPPDAHNLTGSTEDIEKKLVRLSSIGKPLEDVEIRIFDEGGGEVKRGDIGEIAARGSRLMKGYWNRQEETSDTIRDGWLFTGDLGYQDEDGYIFLSGRAKDFIKRGGEMISPEEVEQVLQSHLSVDEAAIIGVPDIDWGERVRAIVVIKKDKTITEQELIEFCRDRLASFKRPESVIFTNELPRNPLGKVLKRVLRDQHSNPIT